MAESLTDQLAARFRERTLPKQEWTHTAHLKVGLWHLLRSPANEALERLREGISRYNESVGGVNSPTSGYHETITRFYVWAIDLYLKNADRDRSVDELAEGLIAVCGAKDFPLRYYSRDRLMSTEARLAWVEPDLAPLDDLRGPSDRPLC